MASLQGWFYWALLSAIFAAFTAIFAKIGLAGIDSDLRTYNISRPVQLIKL